MRPSWLAAAEGIGRSRDGEVTDPVARELLPARPQWPCRRRAAKQRDELAPSYAEHGDFLPGVALPRG